MKNCPHCGKSLDPRADDPRAKDWKQRTGREHWSGGSSGGVYRVHHSGIVMLIRSEHAKTSSWSRKGRVVGFEVSCLTPAGGWIAPAHMWVGSPATIADAKVRAFELAALVQPEHIAQADERKRKNDEDNRREREEADRRFEQRRREREAEEQRKRDEWKGAQARLTVLKGGRA